MTSRDEVIERILANAGLEGILDEREIGLILDNLQPGDEIGEACRVVLDDPEFTQEQYLEAVRIINKAGEEVEQYKIEIARQAAEDMRETCAKIVVEFENGLALVGGRIYFQEKMAAAIRALPLPGEKA